MAETSLTNLGYAVQEDAEDMARIHTKAIHATGPSHYSDEVVSAWANPNIKDVANQISASISDKGTIAIVARNEEVVIGYGLASLSRSYLGAIYVSPSWMRERIGSMILLRLEDEARNRGLNQFQLDASLNSESFYKKNGYQVIERSFHMLRSRVQMACVKMRKNFLPKTEIAPEM